MSIEAALLIAVIGSLARVVGFFVGLQYRRTVKITFHPIFQINEAFLINALNQCCYFIVALNEPDQVNKGHDQ